MELERKVDFERALDLAFEGKSLKEITLSLGCNQREFYNLRKQYPVFGQAIAEARAEGWLIQADSLLTMYDDHPNEDPQRLKGRSDNIKWLLERVRREMFGASIEVNHKVTDVRQALAEARARVLNVTPTVTPVEITDQSVIDPFG